MADKLDIRDWHKQLIAPTTELTSELLFDWHFGWLTQLHAVTGWLENKLTNKLQLTRLFTMTDWHKGLADWFEWKTDWLTG